MSSEEPPYQCYGCQKDMPNYEPDICCNGHECGCYGQPLGPPICSSECWDKVFPKPDVPLDFDLGVVVSDEEDIF